MRAWGQLSNVERGAALHGTRDILLNHLIEGVLEIDMPNRILQRDFDRILSDARKNEISTDLAKKMLLKHVAIGRELVKLIVAIAEGSSYNKDGSFLIDTKTKEMA
ncbi:MAG: hypothetical protein HC840_00450 [Leptolyngbyaceae cyanobacterium RM2_2_4]|nr:hypothetical protein [Leptolyngbyaceae cyanobacterium RM2_2_4]